MKETLSIMQMIAEEKAIKKRIMQLLADDFKLIGYYQKNRPYCGARTAEEQEKDQIAKLQAFNDLLRRFSAIKKAHTKANRETMVVVPEEPNLFARLGVENVGVACYAIMSKIKLVSMKVRLVQ